MRHSATGTLPRPSNVLRFAQVGQGYDIAGVGCSTGFVGHPHLNTLYRHTTGYCRQGAHVLVIGIAEVMGKIKVPILFVIRYRNLITGSVNSSTTRYTLTGRFLLTEYSLEFQFAELDISTETEQAAHSRHETYI